jgi:hypothetical protein
MVNPKGSLFARPQHLGDTLSLFQHSAHLVD